MIRPLLILLIFLTASVLAQDESSENEPAADTSSDAEQQDPDELPDDFDDDVLSDTQDHTEDDEDVFVPTDEVSFQQSVPFPTDI